MIPDTCIGMLQYHALTQLSIQEVEEGWALLERGDLVVKIKTFLEANVKRLDGTRSILNDLKKTYEVVGDHRCNSYDIQRVPAYETAMKGLREGTKTLLEALKTESLSPEEQNVRLQQLLFPDLARNLKKTNSKSSASATTNNNTTKQMLLLDESDLAHSVLAHYDKDHQDATHNDFDVEIEGLARVKPTTARQSNQNQAGKIAIDTPHSPSTASHSRPGTSSAPLTSKGAATATATATSPSIAGGNFTFEDFAALTAE